MDIYEIRRNNLRVIVEAISDGKQARLAERLERPANLISRYLKTKKIGDDFARHVESRCDLHPGSMDRPFDAPAPGETVILYGMPVSKESVDVAYEIDKLPPEMRDQVAQLVHSMVKHQKLGQRMKRLTVDESTPPPPPSATNYQPSDRQLND
jgi:hypothetical protein